MAFWGGIFAGALRLDVTQDPLRTWVERTSAQAGVSEPGAGLRASSSRAGEVLAQQQWLLPLMCLLLTKVSALDHVHACTPQVRRAVPATPPKPAAAKEAGTPAAPSTPPS